MFSRSSPAKNPNPQASIVFMDEDRSTSSLLGRLARDILPKPSYTSALPSSSRVALDGTATTSTTFPPTAELRDEDFVMSQQFDPGSQRTMPPIPGGSMSRRTWRRNLPLATPDPSHFSSGTDSQIGRYKSERRAGDRLRSLNLPSTQKMMHSAIDKIKHKTGKALKARRLHRGLNWMQLRNMNKRAEKEEEGESGLSKITAKQLGEILRRSHDVPQVVMPGSKGKERAVEENNDGDTDNGDTDTDVGGDTDDEKEDKENVGPNAGPSTPHAQGAVRRESLVTSSVNAQEPVTPTRMLISSTRRGTVEEGNDKGRPELPKTPIPNRKLMHSVSSLTFPVVEEVSDTPTKPLRKHASDPLVLRNLSEEACRSKVTNSTGLSQFPFVQPTTFDLPGDITQSIFQEKLVVQQPLPQFSDINIPPIISDQDIVEQLHIEIDNQQQRIIEEVYTTSSDVHQSGDPQFVPFDNTAQLTLQEAQQPQFSFPDYTNQPLTLEQPQVSSHESSALQLQSSVSAANNPLSQFTFQMQQQQAFSFMPMSSTFQQGAAQAMENVDHQPQPTVPQPAEGPARTDDAFPILSSLFLNSAIAPIPQNTRLTNELSIPIEDSTLKQSSLFGSSGAEAFVKEEPILPHRPTPTDSFDILVEVDDKSWGAKRRRHREHRNVRRRTVFGPLNHRHLPTPPKTAYTTHLPRGSEEDLIRRLVCFTIYV
ncbi:hypothetical protein AX15_000401 [Amanita polypyramis BW_CC]|nr:hypothetical protein AX15_000401 [Amanita polypyramis BW_CC]